MPHTRHALSGARAAAVLVLVSVGTLLSPTAAAAGKLIPPPGPWPTDIVGATNPLIDTPFVLNGTNATVNANLKLWLPVRRQRRNSLTTTPTANVVVEGHLRNRDNRHSIAGATVTVVTQNVYAPEWTPVINLITDRKGNFAARVGAGYHRRLGVIYYPAVTSTSPIYSRRVLVRAKSIVELERPYHRRRAYRFDGRVSGGIAPIPPTGLLIALQVRNRTGWVTARIARTTASGAFRVRYTFPRAARLKVRVLVPAQTAWALYAGYSQVRTIYPR